MEEWSTIMNVPTAPRILAALALAACTLTTASLHAQLGISVNVETARIAPPPLPEYEQPEAPGDGYIWTPGYWSWDDQAQDYFWVPGTWVMPPEAGLLWTPGYWAYDNDAYTWNEGYWSQDVGFYGGVDYGFGYSGTGYDGGYWSGSQFFYNTAVNRIDMRFVRNVYTRPVDHGWFNRGPRIAFNGGPGGINLRPSHNETEAFREHHIYATGPQRSQWDSARRDRSQFSGFNHGTPPAAATAQPVQGPSGFRGAAPAQGAAVGAWNRGEARGQNGDPANQPPRVENGNNGGNGYRSRDAWNNGRPTQNSPAPQAPAQVPSYNGYSNGGRPTGVQSVPVPSQQPVRPQSAPAPSQPMRPAPPQQRGGPVQGAAPQVNNRPQPSGTQQFLRTR
jgi:hypothetical protein